MHEQGSYDDSKICGYSSQSKKSALMLASRMGMPDMVEKLLAAGAKAETTDEVKGRE